MALAVGRLRGRAAAVAAGFMLAIAGSGSWIFYNTDVLNVFTTGEENERFAADYERQFLPFEAIAQPTITATRLDVDLYPEERRVEVSGRYELTNLSGELVSEIHVRLSDLELELCRLQISGGRLTQDYRDFGYRIYRLERPMAPLEKRELTFATRRWPRGFRNNREDTNVVGNGIFLNNLQLTPVIGMDRLGLLEEPSQRRRLGLTERLRPPPVDDPAVANRALVGGGWMSADIRITTTAGQTPIGPGKRVSDAIVNGRRTARFVSAAPILNFYSVQSARYVETHRMHRGTHLFSVYYHPGHRWNVDRMLEALQAGLDYFESNFGPYPLRQIRIVEFPAYAGFAQSFSGTVPVSELIAFAADPRDQRGRDYVTFLAAHELAHQWWLHQVAPANVRGGTMLVETLAQYSALMVMRRLYGDFSVRRFLRRELDEYLRSRSFEPGQEQPLASVENQQYIHYHKGALAMYLLERRLGEAAVNRALARLLRAYRFRGPPFPRSMDLVALLQEEATTLAQLATITDLLERITIYDFKLVAAKVSGRTDGRWDVIATIDAHKFYAGGRDFEKEAPLAEPVELGLFTADPDTPAFALRNVEFMGLRPLRSGLQRLRFVTTRKPTHIGVAPYYFYIDRDPSDNVKTVPEADQTRALP